MSTPTLTPESVMFEWEREASHSRKPACTVSLIVLAPSALIVGTLNADGPGEEYGVMLAAVALSCMTTVVLFFGEQRYLWPCTLLLIPFVCSVVLHLHKSTGGQQFAEIAAPPEGSR